MHDFLKRSTFKSMHVGDQGSRVHSHNRVGKEQYADIFEMTRNAIKLVLTGEI